MTYYTDSSYFKNMADEDESERASKNVTRVTGNKRPYKPDEYLHYTGKIMFYHVILCDRRSLKSFHDAPNNLDATVFDIMA